MFEGSVRRAIPLMRGSQHIFGQKVKQVFFLHKLYSVVKGRVEIFPPNHRGAVLNRKTLPDLDNAPKVKL